jgi:hypothetical protein
MVIIRRLLLLGTLAALRFRPVQAGSRLLDRDGSFLTDENGNRLTG